MTSARGITYLSSPAEVSMGDHWYEIASTGHFWIRRRFRVLQRLAGDLVSHARAMAEVGCGSGILQRQIEEAYEREVAGFDLNEVALEKNISQLSSIHCYNILERHPTLQQRYDVIFLFDVLEHIVDEAAFLDALIFHLAPGGYLILNVPAGQWAYSEYDRAVGHVRRYMIRTLREAVEPRGFDIASWTYWGLSLVPVLFLRNLRVRRMQRENEIIRAGLDSRNGPVNQMMGLLAACEPIPQKLVGTSLMAVLQVSRAASPSGH
jgi:SAM-dependent methyltransferase